MKQRIAISLFVMPNFCEYSRNIRCAVAILPLFFMLVRCGLICGENPWKDLQLDADASFALIVFIR